MEEKNDYILVGNTSGSGSAVTVETVERKTTYNLSPQPDLWRITEELSALGMKIDALNRNMEHLIRLMNPPVQQLFVESFSFDQAKEMVSTYMRDNRTASISELSENLQIDLQTLCEVIEKLKDEGRLKERE